MELSYNWNGVTQEKLDRFNVSQAKRENRERFKEFGGVEKLLQQFSIDINSGLTDNQIKESSLSFGTNAFPKSPMKSFISLVIDALSDTTLIILMISATVSLIIGCIEEPQTGYIEGVAIFIAIILVTLISAGNDYTKELQFRALEKSSQQDERCSVLRSGSIQRICPEDLVVGDIIVLQAGDMVPADSIVLDHHTILSNESSLTGEPDDLKKSLEGDCFLMSSCLMTEGEEIKALVFGIGLNSQWGRIKVNLISEPENTPLQDKLEDMATTIGYFGLIGAACTFIAIFIRTFTTPGSNIATGIVNGFILAVTILVAAIPEGLPLAVTIALAFSTKKMYNEQCFIRVLAACETMGNATVICSDKTGTLTENRMTVVEGWFGNKIVKQDELSSSRTLLDSSFISMMAEQICINRTAYLVHVDSEGKKLDRPSIIGNKTEGALIFLAQSWGFDEEKVKKDIYVDGKDMIFSFNSSKKRSTAILFRKDGSVRLYCKGATEWILRDCTHYSALQDHQKYDSKSHVKIFTVDQRKKIEDHVLYMASQALRTLCLAHRDFPSVSALPSDWATNPPDFSDLVCDCVVGIIDPLRSDVKEAVSIAQGAGVKVKMVTGDNIHTAQAIARQCGILTTSGIAMEGPDMRVLTPKQLDEHLPRLQVLARSSPEDKLLLVSRLNGHGLAKNEEDFNAKYKTKGYTWVNDRDRILPGYEEEWSRHRPFGGEVVGVTGDGTNDAPALKAADVGLSMGITGTKVAQSASDIVLLDDRFSSIVRAIKWGRAVYDSIRKFLQFQLTVNVVAIVIVFVGAVAGFESPLSAVQMLWVNLVMDTFAALALATDEPTLKLLQRKPYKRTALLLSRPMLRNIAVQSVFQLILLMILLFKGASLFNISTGAPCASYDIKSSSVAWNATTTMQSVTGDIYCSSFTQYCSGNQEECLSETYYDNGVAFQFQDLQNYQSTCLGYCKEYDFTHGTILFNTFIFCQVFNMFNARMLFNEVNIFENLFHNWAFIGVVIITAALQIMLVEVGGIYVSTSPLTWSQWLITIGLSSLSLLFGVFQRILPVTENPDDFVDDFDPMESIKAKAKSLALVHYDSKSSLHDELIDNRTA